MQRSKFDVDEIPGARGVHRSATAEDIARVGTKDELPIDLYWVGFTDGSSVYSVTLQGQPGTVSQEQAAEDRERVLRTDRRQLAPKRRSGERGGKYAALHRYSATGGSSPSPAVRATRPASARSATWSLVKMAET